MCEPPAEAYAMARVIRARLAGEPTCSERDLLLHVVNRGFRAADINAHFDRAFALAVADKVLV